MVVCCARLVLVLLLLCVEGFFLGNFIQNAGLVAFECLTAPDEPFRSVGSEEANWDDASKDSCARAKPVALASGYGRHKTVTPERTPVSVGEWPSHAAVLNL